MNKYFNLNRHIKKQNIKTKETMNTEENKRMLALSCIVADLKAENMELEQRLQHLENDYADVFHQLNDKVLRKDEATSKQTQDEMQHLRDH